jgi:hypothetical protein
VTECPVPLVTGASPLSLRPLGSDPASPAADAGAVAAAGAASTPGDHQADGEADVGPDGSELRPSRDVTVMRLLSATKRDSTWTPSGDHVHEATFRVLN